jgi:hypothetical protein
MHPLLIDALVRQRRAELLRHQHFRNSEADNARSGTTRAPGSIHRARHALGSALVRAGTRLTPPTASPGLAAPGRTPEQAVR